MIKIQRLNFFNLWTSIQSVQDILKKLTQSSWTDHTAGVSIYTGVPYTHGFARIDYSLSVGSFVENLFASAQYFFEQEVWEYEKKVYHHFEVWKDKQEKQKSQYWSWCRIQNSKNAENKSANNKMKYP